MVPVAKRGFQSRGYGFSKILAIARKLSTYINGLEVIYSLHL